MADEALRRFLDRASAPVPVGLEAAVLERVRQERRSGQPWRWVAAAAAVLLVVGVVAWQAERDDDATMARTGETGRALVSTHAVGDGDVVTTWLPEGFIPEGRDSRSTRFGDARAHVSVVLGELPAATGDEVEERLAPELVARRIDGPDLEELSWHASFGDVRVVAEGLTEATTLRVALGLVERRRLEPVRHGERGVDVPSLEGMDYEAATATLERLGLRARWAATPGPDDALGRVEGQRPLAGQRTVDGSTVTLVVSGPSTPDTPAGERPSVDGWMPTASAYGTGGYIPNRIFYASFDPTVENAPTPVVFLRGELAGYFLPGGFVPTDQLLDAPPDGDSASTTTVVGQGTATTSAPARFEHQVELGGVTVHHPDSWHVVRSGCPDDRTILVLDRAAARPGPGDCPEAGASEWLLLEPVPRDVSSVARTCGPGFINGIAMCQANEGRIERRLYDGLDVLVTLHHGDSGHPELNAIDEALSFIGASGAELPQSMEVAQQAVVHLLAGDCGAIAAEGDPDLGARFVDECRRLVPPQGSAIQEARGLSAGGSVSTQTIGVRVLRPGGSGVTYAVRTQQDWSREQRRGIVRVSRLTIDDEPWPPGQFAPDS